MNKDENITKKDALQDYPGTAVNTADGETVTKAEVEERTKSLNNNPRNTDEAMPVNPD